MPNWTPEQLRDYENKARRKLPSAQPEQVVQDEPLRQVQGAQEGPPRIVVRIRSCRQKLLDPDNLCAKSLIDGLRYARLIPDDRPQDIELVVTQEKCAKEEDRTEIEIEFP